MILGLIIAALIACAVVFFVSTYKVVDPNEAHIIVFMGSGRKIYSATSKTSYFYIPLLMKRFILPLTNVKMDIQNIHLHDKEVAPFVCDVISWLRVADPVIAAERLSLNQPFTSLQADLVNIVQSVARAAAMKQEILDIMRDRMTFSKAISEEVGTVLDSWGVSLVNLEVNDIRDDEQKGSTVISNYEAMRRAQVETKARLEVAERNREAVQGEENSRKESENAKTVAEESVQQRRIEKDKNIGIAQQEQQMEIAKREGAANAERVAAFRTLEVGKAEALKMATIETATGIAEADRVKGEKEAAVITLRGQADASAIEAKGSAEAIAKDKMADALTKFNEAATGIEKIHAWADVEKTKAIAMGAALEKADLKLVTSGKGGNFFGLPLNAESGADLGQMVEGMGGIDKITDLIGAFMGKKKE